MNNKTLDPDALIAKANKVCSSARTLLECEDTNSAVSRAYYAMFDAARAALLVSDAPVETSIGRTHSGLISAFSKFLVKSGVVDKEVGQLLSLLHEARLLADYTGDFIAQSKALELVEKSEFFVATIQNDFFKNKTRDAIVFRNA